MNTQERWDNIIKAIETYIESRPHDYLEEIKNPKELSDQFFAAGGYYGLDDDAKRTFFQRMIDKSFKEYFDMRVDMYLYKTILNQPEYNKTELQNIADATESSLIKRFRKTFNDEEVTPSNVFKTKDPSLYEEPRYWITLSNEQHNRFEELIAENEALRESEAQAREAEKKAKEEAVLSKAAEQEARKSEQLAKESEAQARHSEKEAKEEAAQSKASELAARISEQLAKDSEAQARNSEKEAKEEAAQSKVAELQARKSELYAKASEEQARHAEKEHKENARRAKLAYKELRITILLVIAAIVVIIGCFIRNSWAGNYVPFNLTITDDVAVARLEQDVTYSIKPFTNKIIVSDSDGAQRKIKVKLKRNSITWTDADSGIIYSGQIYNDGSIISYEYMNDELLNDQFRLVRATSFEEWQQLWDGYYEVFINSDGYSSQNGYSVTINLKNSLFILADILGDETQVGSLTYCGPDHLIFMLPSMPELILQANLTGSDTFTVSELNSDEVLFKCFRVIE